MTARDFEDLVIFQNARTLYKKIYPLTKRGDWRYDSVSYSRFVLHLEALWTILLKGLSVQATRSLSNFCILPKARVAKLDRR